jgi:hypothetical protein
MIIFMGYWWTIKAFCYMISKRGQSTEISHICKVYKFLFFIQFWFMFLFFAPRASGSFWWITSISYSYRHKLLRNQIAKCFYGPSITHKNDHLAKNWIKIVWTIWKFKFWNLV